MDVLLNDR